MKYWPAIWLLALLQGCAGTLPAKLAQDAGRGQDASAHIDELPFFPQDDYQCGPAALATVLAHNGLAVMPEDLIGEVFVPGRKGSFQFELAASARRHEQLAYPLQGGLNALLDELDAGHPVLVLQNLGLSWYPQWHYAVARGYDLPRRELILNSGTLENYRLALATFARTWVRAEEWGLVILSPGQLPTTAAPDAYFSAILPQLSGAGSASTAIQRQLLQAGLERWPQHLELLMAHGNQLYAQGELQAALQEFERAASYHPDYAYAWNNQAVVAAELGLREQALAAVTKARALAPADDATVNATWQEL
ncbi:MAG TPA: PA2778 family cysteine peptidase, partial [Hyphomicrobiales bacterium]|nr:PA2778 family cysteine peptidase [Hyphomicrobiales bacterium]